MKRLTLFLKGNVDVHDSLHSCRVGGKLAWNGINEVLRTKHPSCVARIKHETWTRSDALLQANGTAPKSLTSRGLSLGSYPLESQFSRALFEVEADAIILSIQADLTTSLVKHREEGFLFYPSEIEQWSMDDRQWFKTDFERTGHLSLPEFLANMTAIVAKIRERSDVPILLYNMSAVVPGETIHCHQGFDEAYSTRIRKFNLGLIDLSERTGISIIDIDSVLARKGTDAFKIDALHLTPPGYRLVAEEVVRVLDDLGLFAGEQE